MSIGAVSMENNLRGDDKVAAGFWSGRVDTASLRSVYIGRDAGYNNQHNDVVAIGYRALYNNTVGATVAQAADNVAIGSESLTANTTGSENTAIGIDALWSNTTGGFNTAVGANTLLSGNATGNTAVGSNALVDITTGGYNTAMGINSMFSNTAGTQNIGVGYRAMFGNLSGNTNIAIGSNALETNTAASNNIAIGYQALFNTTTAGNTGLGYSAGFANTTGTNNTLIGNNSDVSAGGLTNATAVGTNAFIAQSNSMVLGSINGINTAAATTSVGIGTNTPGARLHVRRNGASGGTFIANPSLIVEDNAQSYIQLSNPTATENGILSGSAISTIRSGIVFGADSSVFLRSGGNNTRMIIDNNGYVGIGTTAIYPLTQLHLHEPLSTNVNLRVSSSASGFEPGLELVKVGGSDWKLRVNTGGNLVYARAADDFVTTPTDYYQMSTGSFIPVNDASNTLGGPSNRWTTVYATVGAINTSDARDKENIADLNYGLKEVMKLRPVSFSWKENPQWGKKIGFIAQEVQPILNEVVQVGEVKSKTAAKNDNGKAANAGSDKLGIFYSDIIPVTVKAIQEQQQTIEQQQKQIEELKKKNEQLQKDMQLIKTKLGIL